MGHPVGPAVFDSACMARLISNLECVPRLTLLPSPHPLRTAPDMLGVRPHGSMRMDGRSSD